MERLITALVVILGVPALTVLYIAIVEFVLGRFSHRVRSRIRPWLWIAPALVLMFFYLIYPGLQTIYLSFLDAKSDNFVGLDNYFFTFADDKMLTAFRNNLIWLVLFTGLTVTLGLGIALLSDRVPYEAAVKAMIFLPMAISYVAAGVIWKLMYEYENPGRPQTGFVNALFDYLIPAFKPQSWLIDKDFNNIALIIIGVWIWTGFAMVILSAGLKSIPDEVLEAARVDGANEFQILRSITLPMLSSTIAVVVTTMIINVLKIFDIVYVMTNGNYDTEVIANRMYKEMFNFHHFGRASTIAVILLFAIIPVMIYNIRRFREQEALR